ncbi:MAG: alkaline phosphatase D family protein [Nannocystaceae bacterium]|nr:alkaline phosphatase D family protein [Nannocystaceae bacterium]
MPDESTPSKRPETCVDNGETNPCHPGALTRRRFLELSAACVATPVLLQACSGDDVSGTGGTAGSSTGGNEGSSDTAFASEDGGTDSTTGGGESGIDPDDTGTDSTGDDDTGTTGGDEPVDDGGEEFPFEPGGVPEDQDMFPRTVMAGEMQPDSVLLAIYIDDAQPKSLRLWRESQIEGNIILVHEADVVPDDDGFAKVPVDGLAPGTWYSYAFFAGDFETRSLIGNVRTAISANSEEVIRVAFASCNGGYYEPGGNEAPFTWPTMTTQAGLEYDLMIHLGDMGYMDTVFSEGGTYEMYLEAWGGFHAGGYREVYPKTGLYATWDDHEVTDNGSVDPWARSTEDVERIENAIEAYYTVMPIEGTNSMDRLWRSFSWGQTVEFIMLDSRYERTPTKGGLYLSPEQMAFLKDRIANSPCRFKVICNSVPFTDLEPWFGIAASDRWEGYPAQRQEILDFVNDEDISNVYWVTGDIHTNYVSHVQPSPGPGAGDSMREICVTSGNTNPAAFLLGGSQFPYAAGDPRTLVMTFDPSNESVHVEFRDGVTGAVDYEATLFSGV